MAGAYEAIMNRAFDELLCSQTRLESGKFCAEAVALGGNLVAIGCPRERVAARVLHALGDQLWTSHYSDATKEFILTTYIVDPPSRSSSNEEIFRKWVAIYGNIFSPYWTKELMSEHVTNVRKSIKSLLSYKGGEPRPKIPRGRTVRPYESAGKTARFTASASRSPFGLETRVMGLNHIVCPTFRSRVQRLLFLADVAGSDRPNSRWGAESDGPTKHFLAEGRTVRPRPRRYAVGGSDSVSTQRGLGRSNPATSGIVLIFIVSALDGRDVLWARRSSDSLPSPRTCPTSAEQMP